jgi:hypothetical protein
MMFASIGIAADRGACASAGTDGPNSGNISQLLECIDDENLFGPRAE